MKPVDFEYFDPATPAEALELLGEFKDDAKLLAGGQSLVPMLNFRLVRPQCLIDINRLGEMDYIRETGDELQLGALTRERTIETSELVRARLPILSDATAHIGHLAIRNRGTIGGSIAHADAAAEYPMILKLLGAEIQVSSAERETRWVHVDDFFLDFMTVGLEPDELITAIKVPLPPDNATHGFQEFARRQGDFAIVSVGVLLEVDGSGRCQGARISLGGVGPTPVRAEDAEAHLLGEKCSDELFASAAQKAADATDPTGDMHASSEYRTEMTRVFTQRCLAQAWTRNRGKG